MNGDPAPTQPVAGQEFFALTKGDVVQVLLQNLAANANGARGPCTHSPTAPHHGHLPLYSLQLAASLAACRRTYGAALHAAARRASGPLQGC